jgi:hypothetical protein
MARVYLRGLSLLMRCQRRREKLNSACGFALWAVGLLWWSVYVCTWVLVGARGCLWVLVCANT